MIERSAKPSEALDRALGLHKAGRYREALDAYRQVLAVQPANVEALTYGGVALLEVGRVGKALDALRRAVALAPDSSEAHGYLANALQVAGRLQDAEAGYRRALEIAPDDARTLNNLGVVLQKLGRVEDAVAGFRRAAALQPSYAEAHNNLCNGLKELGDLDAALAAGRRALDIKPDYPDAYVNYGNALADAGRPEDAIAAYRSALSIQPGSVKALNNLAMAQVVAGRPRDALAALDACLAADPGNTLALATKSVALNEAGEHNAYRDLVDCDSLIGETRVRDASQVDSLSAFNDALAGHVCAHPTLAFEPDKHSTRRGRQSGDLLAEPKGPIAVLERIIHDAVEGYVEDLASRSRHPFLAKRPRRSHLDIWGVVLESQGHQIPHIHTTGWISGCYYVKLPDAFATAQGGHDGWIEFGRPHERYRARAEPKTRLVRPEEGLMLLFPSFFFHRTVPFEAPEQRISIAFDIRPVA